MTPRYQIGEIVFCKITEKEGKVVGAFPGNLAEQIANHDKAGFDFLDKLYPDWRDKYCYMVDYGEEIPLITKRQFEKMFPDAVSFLSNYELIDIRAEVFVALEDQIQPIVDLDNI